MNYPLYNPLQTAADLGYYIIKSKAPDNLSGFYMKKDKFPFIFVNSSHSLGRQNFSLWHEVYHNYRNHDNGISDFNSQSIEEREAEIFAGCIMLPDEQIKKLADKPIEAEYIAQISVRYQMSFNAVVVRFMQENYLYEEYKELKQLSAKENADVLNEIYKKQGLSTDILHGTHDLVISPNIMRILTENYNDGKLNTQTLNEIIGRIEGLADV